MYRATDVEAGKVVALKILRSMDPKVLPRFRREAEVLSRLDHPNIVRLLDAGEVQGRHYLAMECIEGVPVEEGSLSIPEAVRVLRDAAMALDHVHEHGIVHLDVKPSNLLLDGSRRVVLTDFDIARQLESAGKGVIAGTPPYMSPEQLGGEVRLDARSDVYSLGATGYFLLTRRDPFPGRSSLERMYRVLNQPPIPPRALNPRISAELESIVLKAMSRSPEDRYPSAREMARDLDRVLGREGPRTTIATAIRLLPWPRERWAAGAALLLVVAGLAVAGGALLGKVAFGILFGAGFVLAWGGGGLVWGLRTVLRRRSRAREAVREAGREITALVEGRVEGEEREESAARIRAWIEEALAEWPGVAGTEMLEGILSYHTGHPERALCYLEQADHKGVRDYRVSYYKGLIYLERYFKERRFPAATFNPRRRRLEFSPPPPEGRVARLWRNKGIRALQRAWEAMGRARGEEAARKRKLVEGALALYDGRYAESRRVLEDLLSAGPVEPEALYFHALAVYHDNDIGAFTAAVERLQRLGKPQAWVYRLAGKLQLVRGQIAQAEGRDPFPLLGRSVELLSRAIEIRPDAANYNSRAAAYYWITNYKNRRMQDFSAEAESAIRDLKEAVRLNPWSMVLANLAEMSCDLARLRQEKGVDASDLLRQATEAAERALAEPDCSAVTRVRAMRIRAEVKLALAREAALRGRPYERVCREAVRELEGALRVADRETLRADIHANLGEAFGLLADGPLREMREKAIEEYSAAIGIGVEHEPLYIARAEQLEKAGRIREALQDLERVLERMPGLRGKLGARVEALRARLDKST